MVSLCVAWFVLLAKCAMSSDWLVIKGAEHYGATLSLLICEYVIVLYPNSNRSNGQTGNSTVPSTAVLFLKSTITGTTLLLKYGVPNTGGETLATLPRLQFDRSGNRSPVLMHRQRCR